MMLRSLAALFVFALGVSIASAEESAKLTSFKALIADGYEIKGVITTPRNPPEPSVVNVVVTLQKGKSVAVCDYHSNVWNNLTAGEAGVEASNRCALRSY
jgi:hypothetical protein